MNPIDSINAWCEGVNHGPETRALYVALVLEECAELLDSVTLRDSVSGEVESTERPALILKRLSRMIRSRDVQVSLLPEPSLDAALDTAWVALCLARALTGDKLPAAWAELHRSNVTDKQVDGAFIKDASNKVQKPPTWTPPNFAQFLLPGQQAEGGAA
jgi:hypothetical protein